MKYSLLLLSFFITVFAQENLNIEAPKNYAAAFNSQKDVVLIDPSKRAQDFIQAYEIIKKGKSPQNIFFHLSDGRKISNVAELVPMTNGTLILFKVTTNMGSKYELISIENISSISQQ